MPEARASVAVLACGALAREIKDILAINKLEHVTLKCLPAKLHNHPEKIPGRVAEAIDALRPDYGTIVVAYGDCGTGGALDRVLTEKGVSRIAGPHCYSFFSGNEAFAANQDDDVTSFYLTDFLARQFETLIVKPLWLDTHPELLPAYFGHYEKLVYLAQTGNSELDAKAKKAASFLGLDFERRDVGYGDLTDLLTSLPGPDTDVEPKGASERISGYGPPSQPALVGQVGNHPCNVADAPL